VSKLWPDRHTDTSTDNKGCLKLVAHEPIMVIVFNAIESKDTNGEN